MSASGTNSPAQPKAKKRDRFLGPAKEMLRSISPGRGKKTRPTSANPPSASSAVVKPNTRPATPASAVAGPAGPNPSSKTPTSLWEKAIKSLPEDDQKAFDFNVPGCLGILEDILRATEAKRDLCRDKMWRFTWKGEEVILRDVADKVIGWVNEFKTLGTVITEADPIHLAIPWAPIKFLLEVAVKDNQKMGEMLLGLERITNLMGRCAIYEELYLGNGSETAKRVEEALIALYVEILSYLVSAKKYYAENTIVRVAWGVLDTEGPLESLKTIQQEEDNVLKETSLAEAKGQREANQDLRKLLEEYKIEIGENLKVIRDGLKDTEREKILGWVSDIAYGKYHQYAKEGRTEGTCEWLLKRREFIEWQTSSVSNILWLHSDPGAGKTKLTSMVVDTLLPTHKTPRSDEALAYFYCKRDAAGSSDPGQILRSIVRQLSFARTAPDLHQPVVAAYEAKKEDRSELGIRESLNLIISLTSLYQCTTIVIDALDECGEANRRQEFFCGLKEVIDNSTGLVKLFVSSRNDDDIKLEFVSKTNIDIEENDNSDDIELFVKKEVTRCITGGRLLRGEVDDSLKSLVISTLLEKAHGMFMWVDLQIKELCDLDFEVDVRAMLGNLPETLEQAYDEIYQRILSRRMRGPEIAEQALMWVMCSCYPLPPDRLVAIVSSQSSITRLSIDILLRNCHNLLRVDKQQNVIRFVHLSVREYLEKKPCFNVLDTNTMAAEFCFSILGVPGLRSTSNKNPNLTVCQPSEELVEYSVLCWPTHVQRCCDQRLDHKVWDMLKGFLGSFPKPSKEYISWHQRANGFLERERVEKPWITELPFFEGFKSITQSLLPSFAASIFGLGEQIKDLWDSGSWDVNSTDSRGQSLVYLASSRGHSWVVETLLKRGADANAKASIGKHALLAAAEGGHKEVVEVLLSRGVDVNVRSDEYGNALHAAAEGGHGEVVEALLSRGADVNAQGGSFGNALQAAACCGNEKVVEALLSRGADVNAQGGCYGNALQAAANGGHGKVVEILLSRGADVNAQGGSFWSALTAAAWRGHEEVVEMLLDRGADVELQSTSGSYGNALHAAAATGHEKVVEALLSRGANVNAQGSDSGNALQAAVAFSHEKIAKILLSKGADINAQGGSFGNALQAAAYSGSEKMTEVILSRGVDVNVQGGKYGNALQAAASGGHGNVAGSSRYEKYEKVAEALLSKGANVNAQGGFYGNALQAAVEGGHEKMVKILLSRGADVNAQGGHSVNALQAAVKGGYERVIEALLNGGADVNADGGYYGGALQVAAFDGNMKIVETLLSKGADVNLQGGDYGNALQAAARGGSEEAVEALLNRGADVNAQGGFYMNALQIAAYGGNEKIVEALLSRGADVNIQGGHYGNSLCAAAAGGHKKVVEALLTRGANVNAQSENFGNALKAAIDHDMTAIVDILLRNGAVRDQDHSADSSET